MDSPREQCDIMVRLSEVSEMLIKRFPITVSNTAFLGLGFRVRLHILLSIVT
jgi:hypothetical protein